MIEHSDTVLFRNEKHSIAALIEYNATKIISAAPHLNGRWYYQPTPYFRSHTVNAVIDFISLEFWLKEKTQPRWVTKKIEKHYGFRPAYRSPKSSAPINAGDTVGFILTFQDPEIPVVEDIITFIDKEYGHAKAPKLVEIEVSVDFYPKSGKDTDRAKMVALLMRHIVPPRHVLEKTIGRPRYFGAELKKRSIFFQKAGLKSTRIPPASVDPLRKKPASPFDKKARALVLDPNEEIPKTASVGEDQYENHPGFTDTYYLGPRYGDAHIKVMNKIINNQRYLDHSDDDDVKSFVDTFGKKPEKPAYKILKQKERRARIEVTLRGKELISRNLRDLNDLRGFSFAKLQGDFFRFYHPTFKDPHQASKYTGLRRKLEGLMEAEMPSLFIRAGSIMVHEAQMVMLYRLRYNVKGSKTGRPISASKHWSKRVGKNNLLLAYGELNKRVRGALDNLSIEIKKS